jgi:hypothetical protein
VGNLAELGNEWANATRKLVPVFGNENSATFSLDKRDPNFLFKQLHCFRQRRLRNVEQFGSAANVCGIDYREKVLQAREVHSLMITESYQI